MPALFALSASVLWGVGDFLGGVASRRLPAAVVLGAGQLAGMCAFLVLVGRPGLPAALVNLPGPTVAVAAGAGVAWLGGLACFYRGCAVGSMGVVAPVAASGVFVPVLVGLWGGHRPAAIQLGGIMAAVAGVVLCSTSAGPDGAGAAVRPAASYGAGAALCFGTELALLNQLSHSADENATMLVVRGAALAVLVMALGARALRPGERAPLRQAVPRLTWGAGLVLLTVGVADVAAMSLFVRAGVGGSLPVVAVLASLYPAVTVALGRLLAGDRIHRLQRVGLVAVLVGASMVAAP